MFFYLLFLSIFFLDFASENLNIIPRATTWVPELLSWVALIIVILNVAKNKTLSINSRYLFLFLILMLLLSASVIANEVQPGAVFAGLRTYIKYIPLFFLPVVIQVTNIQIQQQLKFLMILALLQVPIASYQRFIQYAGARTGDIVTGTFETPGVLTIISLSAVTILLSMYYKKILSSKTVVLMTILLLIPPTINETTITLFLLPLAFMIPTIFFIKYAENKNRLMTMIVLGVFSMVIFISGYNFYYSKRWGGNITNIITNEDILLGDISQADTTDNISEYGEIKIGRLDSIVLTYKYLSKYPTKLLMGVGIGNASSSFIDVLSGKYTQEKIMRGGGMTALSSLMWDIGIIGIALVLILFFMIFYDAYMLINRNDIYGALSLGWLAVTCFILISFVYKNLIPQNVIGYIYWYLSGCIIAEKYRQQLT